MKRGRLKLNFITNKSSRNQTFKKRKRGLMKKAKELSTLCGVKVCAVIKSCDNTEPEFWPSREGAEAVHLEFTNAVQRQGFSKIHNHESYLSERIQKDGEKARRLHAENREIELREVMFDLLKGKTLMPHQYGDPSFMRELNLFIGGYANRVTYRTQFLEGSVQHVPPNVGGADAPGPVVGDVNPFVVGTEGSVINPTEAYDHMRQYDGMDMSVNDQAPDHVHHQNMNHQEPFQYQCPTNFYDQTQPMFYGSSQGMNTNHHQEPIEYQTPNVYDQIQPMFTGSSQGMNMHYQEPFQYQPPGNLYDQTQPMFYGSNKDMYTGLNYDQGQSSNQYLNQQMSDVQDLASVASMDQQLPVTSQMPSTITTTTAAADLYGHSINNGWPTRFDLD
ncbi:MADS-box transcription factor PHERES 1-like [Brassica rapa]|nr:MADS-box transcription factor PHERES 1-like [Brassica rapa]